MGFRFPISSLIKAKIQIPFRRFYRKNYLNHDKINLINFYIRFNYLTLTMVVQILSVLIGLAVTSHNAAQATSAQFSNVSLTGGVTGGWRR